MLIVGQSAYFLIGSMDSLHTYGSNMLGLQGVLENLKTSWDKACSLFFCKLNLRAAKAVFVKKVCRLSIDPLAWLESVLGTSESLARSGGNCVGAADTNV